MPREPRIDHEGAWHHVMNRGARRAPVFASTESQAIFLTLVGQTVERFDLEVHGYAVMPNHYHLLVHSVRGNLSRAMRHLSACFTQEINRAQCWDGPVFRGRFHNQIVNNENQLLTVLAYIHLNSLRAGLARRLDQHCWTSHRAYLGLDMPPEWLSRELVFSLTGGPEAFAELVLEFRRGVNQWPEEFDLTTGRFRRVANDEKPKIKERQESGSGVTDDSLIKAIAMGVSKVNYGTYLKQRCLAALRRAIAIDNGNPHHLLGEGSDADLMVVTRRAVRDAVLERIEALGCCGKA